MCGLLRSVREQLRHFVLHVDPARREEVHFYHCVAVIFEAALADEPSALVGLVGEAVGWADITWLLGWVVGEGLAVGNVAGEALGFGPVSVEDDVRDVQIRSVPPHGG